MSEDDKRLEKVPTRNKKDTNKSSDGIALGIALFALVMIIVNPTNQKQHKDNNTGTYKDTTEKIDTVAVEQSPSAFDTTLLFLKRTIENQR